MSLIEELKREQQAARTNLKRIEEDNKKKKIEEKFNEEKTIRQLKKEYKEFKKRIKKGDIPQEYINFAEEILNECVKDIKKGKDYGVYMRKGLGINIIKYPKLFCKWVTKYYKNQGFKVDACNVDAYISWRVETYFKPDWVYENLRESRTYKWYKEYEGKYFCVVLGIKRIISSKKYLDIYVINKYNHTSKIPSHFESDIRGSYTYNEECECIIFKNI